MSKNGQPTKPEEKAAEKTEPDNAPAGKTPEQIQAVEALEKHLSMEGVVAHERDTFLEMAKQSKIKLAELRFKKQFLIADVKRVGAELPNFQ